MRGSAPAGNDSHWPCAGRNECVAGSRSRHGSNKSHQLCVDRLLSQARAKQPAGYNQHQRPNGVNALKFFKEHGTVIDPTDAVLELMLRPMNVPIESFEPGAAKVAPELEVQMNK